MLSVRLRRRKVDATRMRRLRALSLAVRGGGRSRPGPSTRGDAAARGAGTSPPGDAQADAPAQGTDSAPRLGQNASPAVPSAARHGCRKGRWDEAAGTAPGRVFLQGDDGR